MMEEYYGAGGGGSPESPYPSGGDGMVGTGTLKSVQNQPHDEEVLLSDDEDDSPQKSGLEGGAEEDFASRGDTPPLSLGDDRAGNAAVSEYDDDGREIPGHSAPTTVDYSPRATIGARGEALDAMQATNKQKVDKYDASCYTHLDVSSEVEGVFGFIQQYTPANVELPSTLKCFVPDFIPAIGNIDEFIKMPRPDGRAEEGGTKVLDEPASAQSDTAVLNLQLRHASKRAGLAPAEVASIPHPAKNGAKVATWIKSIEALHKQSPPPEIAYSRPMPDMEKLMEEWPVDMQELLAQCQLPGAGLDVSLVELVTIMCTLLDIPVYENIAESLHVMMSLFLAFQQNPFLHNGGGGVPPDVGEPANELMGL